MGTCESTKDTPKDEKKMANSEFIRNDISIAQALKSLCKIYTQDTISSGFLIQFFKDQEKLFCLMTNEHVITKTMVARKEKFTFYFDNESEIREILLDPKERYIKDFRYLNIDAIVIEILPKDNIPQYFFLKPNIDYINNADILINKEITILQYPDGNSYRAFGTIISKKKNNEFAHSASTLPGSSGSPIFLRNSTKVIGIHKSGSVSENYGNFIGPIFNYFRNFSQNQNIILKNEVKNEIKKEIILDNNKLIKYPENNNNINNNKKIIEKDNNNLFKNELNKMTIIYHIREDDIKNNKIRLFDYHFKIIKIIVI